MEKFWWEKLKAVQIKDPDLEKVAALGKYVFIDVYGKDCHYCYNLRGPYNKLYSHFVDNPKTRKDIVIARVDGGDNAKLADLLDVKSYPMLFLITPHNPGFPITYEYGHNYSDMSLFLEKLPKLDSSGSNVPRKEKAESLKVEGEEKNKIEEVL